MADEKVKKLEKPTWDNTSKRWKMAGAADSMWEWLRNPVDGSDGEPAPVKGYELASMLDPDNPDPTSFMPPPSWMSPTITMKSACVWNAQASQDYMFREGLLPVIRGIVNMGNQGWEQYSGIIDPEHILIRFNYILVDQEKAAYPLTERSTAIIQPIEQLVDESGAAVPMDQTIVFRVELPKENLSGWTWTSASAGAANRVMVHIYA